MTYCLASGSRDDSIEAFSNIVPGELGGELCDLTLDEGRVDAPALFLDDATRILKVALRSRKDLQDHEVLRRDHTQFLAAQRPAQSTPHHCGRVARRPRTHEVDRVEL